MRRTWIVLVAVLISAVLLSVDATHGALARAPRTASHQDIPPVIGLTPIVINLPNLPQPTANVPHTATKPPPHKPTAPPNAVRIALTNGYVRALLQGKAYRVQKVARWPAGKGQLVVTGFYHPTTVSGMWLTDHQPPYRATYRNVIGLNIYVASARRAVVAIAPRRGSP